MQKKKKIKVDFHFNKYNNIYIYTKKNSIGKNKKKKKKY